MKSARNRLSLAAVIAFAIAFVVVGGDARAATTHTSSIQNNAYTPANFTITVGDTITWTNNETNGQAHTVTSNTGAPDTFDSGNINPTQSFSRTFNVTGSIGYHCTIHPQLMTGTIVVQQAGAQTTTTTTTTPGGTTTSSSSTSSTSTSSTSTSSTTSTRVLATSTTARTGPATTGSSSLRMTILAEVVILIGIVLVSVAGYRRSPWAHSRRRG